MHACMYKYDAVASKHFLVINTAALFKHAASAELLKMRWTGKYEQQPACTSWATNVELDGYRQHSTAWS